MGKMVIVRTATEEDIPRILELYRELAITTSQAETHQNPSLDEYRRVFAEICAVPGHQLLVAEEDGIVVSTMVLLIVPNLSHGGLPWALIENMVVDQRYHRQGIGRVLMEYAIPQARERGCYKLQLASNKKRDEAHRFYRSLGFEDSAHGFRMYL